MPKTLAEARHIGFSGTRQGMTEQQQTTVEMLLETHAHEGTLHHGDCVGADREAWRMARNLGWKTICHPPNDTRHRAFTRPNEEERRELPYLLRNRAIVNESDILIAAPESGVEELRSGTWATIRYALRCGKFVLLVWPDGVMD